MNGGPSSFLPSLLRPPASGPATPTFGNVALSMAKADEYDPRGNPKEETECHKESCCEQIVSGVPFIRVPL